MSKLFDFQKYDLTNDNTFTCKQCEESFQCFTSEGQTQFCPCCGVRSTEFEDFAFQGETE